MIRVDSLSILLLDDRHVTTTTTVANSTSRKTGRKSTMNCLSQTKHFASILDSRPYLRPCPSFPAIYAGMVSPEP